MLSAVGRVLAAMAICVVRVYQDTVSRIIPPTCRFQPSCSAYMIEAIQRHGLWRGGALGVWRVLRCNPFSSGGHDPVPVAGRPDDTDETSQWPRPGVR